jgi:hypothetical protein
VTSSGFLKLKNEPIIDMEVVREPQGSRTGGGLTLAN